MRFLFLVEGILLIIAITFLVQFRVITLEELSASRVSVKTRLGRSRLSARPSPVIVVPLAGRSLTDFLPNYVVTKTGCRSGREEEERKGKERRKVFDVRSAHPARGTRDAIVFESERERRTIHD